MNSQASKPPNKRSASKTNHQAKDPQQKQSKHTASNTRSRSRSRSRTQRSKHSPSTSNSAHFPEDIEKGDLPGYIVSPENRKLDEVYGDHIHENIGTHLTGGISTDKQWQRYLKRLLPLPPSHYHVPRGELSTQFITTLAELFNQIVDRKCNADKLIVFQMVILQRAPNVKRSADVKKRLRRRLQKWNDGLFQELVEDTARTMQANLSRKQGSTSPEERARIFDSRIKRGDLRAAVRYITERDSGGILFPEDNLTPDKTVLDVLKKKHPLMGTPGPNALKHYDTLPSFIDLDITEDTVEQVASKLNGGGGLSGIDGFSARCLLLQHGKSSQQLRKAVARFASWLSNGFPPYAAYRAFQWNRLVALPKGDNGVRPIGIGDIWRRLIAKCNLAESGEDAKAICGADQLCAGLTSGIEGAIHGMNQLWSDTETLEHQGFLLVDARNAFNEINRIAMLWNIRHLWPKGARFAFNCYRFHSLLIVRSSTGTLFELYSQEGVTQGDVLAMICYAIGILPLCQLLREIHIDCRTPWYADDAGCLGNFEQIEMFFDDLCLYGPEFGYHPVNSKSILIVRERDIPQATSYFLEENNRSFKIVTGHRYLGGFIGDDSTRDEWLSNKLLDWQTSVTNLALAAEKFPQSAYAGLQKCLQHEWSFIQRVIPNIGPQFQDLEDSIRSDFLSALFGELSIPEDDYRRDITCLPVKHSGLSIPNPSKSAQPNFQLSSNICSHLSDAIKGANEFFLPEHHSLRVSTMRDH